MKRFILLLFLLNLLVSIETNAQTWAEVGTTWHYTDYSPPFYLKPNVFEAIDTATVDGQLCQVMIGHGMCGGFLDQWYTYEEDGKVYYKGQEWENFHLLYDFNAGIGDTIHTSHEMVGPTDLKVIDTSHLFINGELRVVQEFIHCPAAFEEHANMEYGVVIIEGIGSTHCLVPQSPVCSPQTHSIRCFTDDNGLVHYFNEEIACDSTVFVSSTKETENAPFSFEITPNPVSELVSVSMIKKYDNQLTVRVLNIQGNVILQEEFTDNPINSSSWNSGVYFLMLTNEKGQQLTKKFIKM